MKKNLSPSDPRNLPTKSLRSLTSVWSRLMPDTKRERQEQIRSAKRGRYLSLSAALDAVESVSSAMASARKMRNCRRAAEHLGRAVDFITQVKAPSHYAMPGSAKLPKGLMASRLDIRRKTLVLAAYHACYRAPESDHGTEYVSLTASPEKVSVSQVQSKDWNLYRGKFKGWAATITTTTITVPTDWLTRVRKHGIATLDGMMTLDAAPMDGAPEDVSLYAATWLVQGRGYIVTPERGYIAIHGKTSYHGATAEKALSGLRRKIESAAWDASIKTADLDHLVSRAGDIKVCVSDAKAVGACEYGIKSWCNSVGLDYEAGCAPIAEVYAAYQREPRSEARAAILYAIRRRGRKLAA